MVGRLALPCQPAGIVGRLALPSFGLIGGIACTRESLRFWTLSMQLQIPRSMCLPWHCQMGNGSHRLLRTWQEWIDSPLVEEETLYLEGGCTGPKCNYHTEARARARAHRHVNDSEHCCQKPALFV